jgi:hypothetical protein
MKEVKNGLIEYADGSKYWYVNGELHREDGPSIEAVDGSKHWYVNGKLHRKDGPAIEYNNGEKKWFLNDVEFTEDDFNHEIKKIKLNQSLQENLPPKKKDKRWEKLF